MRLEGDLSLTRTWLTDGLEAVASACKRIAVEASTLGLEHYASIALHNLGYVETEMGRPTEAVMHLERAARFWADLPPNPFADFSDLVHAVASTGDYDRAHRLADSAIDKTRSWPRPHAEAMLGKAFVLSIQGRYDEAVEVLTRALENPAILGGGKIILGGLMIDCLYLRNSDRDGYSEAVDVLNSGPLDSRLQLRLALGNALARHRLGLCKGECQEAMKDVAHWSSKGMIATSLSASTKLVHLAFEHRDRRAAARAVSVLSELQARGMLRTNRGWVRLLAPHARRLAMQEGGLRLIADLVDADPEGWRLHAIDALPPLDEDGRALILAAIVRNANRDTTSALAKVTGTDVTDALRHLRVKQAPRLFVRLLGPLSVHRNSPSGPTIPISKKRMRSMLALLGAHIGRPQSRDQVIETLWPEADLTAGVNNLNQTIFQLRRELDPTHREGESTPYLISTPDNVYLHPELVRTDVDEVRKQAAKLQNGPLLRRREAAEQLLSLVRGEFLLDLRYEDWTQALQLRVHAEIRGYLRPLLLADGIEMSHETGVRAACALLSLDPFDETGQFALIRQLAAGGKRQAAKAAADRYVTLLKDDLDEDPSPELTSILGTLKRR
jgi:DNA-binding SARP family transcriptional activator/tetratricopeptide (TPR) repeat protein